MKSNRVIAIGCFYKVSVNYEGQDAEELVLIGIIFSKIEPECQRNEAMMAHIDAPRWNN